MIFSTIASSATRSARRFRETDDYTGLFDLRTIDFDKLSAAFRKGQKKTQAQLLRAEVENKLTMMVRQYEGAVPI